MGEGGVSNGEGGGRMGERGGRMGERGGRNGGERGSEWGREVGSGVERGLKVVGKLLKENHERVIRPEEA